MRNHTRIATPLASLSSRGVARARQQGTSAALVATSAAMLAMLGAGAAHARPPGPRIDGVPSTSRPDQPAADDKATRDDYALDTSKTTSKLKLNGEGRFSIVITAKNGKKVHPDAPLEVTLKAAKGVKAKKTRLGRTDIVDRSAAAPEVQTALRGEEAGPVTLEATVSFFLCTDAWCQRMTDKLTVEIVVEP